MSGEEDLIKSPSKSPSNNVCKSPSKSPCSPSKSPSKSADTDEFIEETLQELDNSLQDLDKFSLSDIPEVSSQSKNHTIGPKLQVNNYEIVVNFFHISHNLT